MGQKVERIKNRTAALIPGIAILVFLSLSFGAQAQTSSNSLYRSTLSQAMRKIADDSYPSAIYNLKQCIQMQPKDPVPYYQLSTVYARLDDDTQAVYYARKAFALAPENLWYEEYLLYLATKYRKPEAVQAVLERRYSRDDTTLGELLDAYAYTESWDKALLALGTYEQRHGRSVATREYRKDIYLHSGDYKGAAEQLKALQKISPDNARYAVEKAMILSATGDEKGSWDYLEDFFRRHPEDGYVAYTLLSHYHDRGDYPRMFEALSVVASDTSFDAQNRLKVLDLTSKIAAQRPEYASAFEQALGKIIASTDDPLAYAYGSEYYYSRGDEKRGRELLEKAVRGGFNDRAAVLQLLYAEVRDNDLETLFRDARMVLDSIGEDPEVYYLYGFSAHSLGQTDQAIAALERGKQLARGGAVQLYVETCSLLGSVYEQAGDYARSAENFELVLAIDPDNAGALNNYGYFMACRGKDLPRARAMLERALALQRDEPAFLDSYAWILYLQGDYPAALQVIERALSLDDDPSAEVLEHYYRILEASGDARVDQARVRYQAKQAAEQPVGDRK